MDFNNPVRINNHSYSSAPVLLYCICKTIATHIHMGLGQTFSGFNQGHIWSLETPSPVKHHKDTEWVGRFFIFK